MDALELIANQIALASHLQELISNWLSELETASSELKELKIKDIAENQVLLENAIKIRRMTMDKLLDDKSNKDMWCAAKHALWSWMYALEVYYANKEMFEIAKLATEQMFQVVSKFLWEEMTTCWRCLFDKLQKDV